MIVYVSRDERWPDYYASDKDSFGHPIEVREEQFKRWQEASDAYDKAQDEIEALWEAR